MKLTVPSLLRLAGTAQAEAPIPGAHHSPPRRDLR